MDTLSPEKEPKGPILGIVVIIILLIVGGLYIFMNERGTTGNTASTTPETTDLGPESNSNDLGQVQAELEATNLNSLDAELKDINADLNTQ